MYVPANEIVRKTMAYMKQLNMSTYTNQSRNGIVFIERLL